MPRVGRYRKLVSLSKVSTTAGDDDGHFDPLEPAAWWCAITPITGSGDGRATIHSIEMRFHPQITIDTRIVYADPVKGRDREFFVRGVQNLEEQGDAMRLLAEEIEP